MMMMGTPANVFLVTLIVLFGVPDIESSTKCQEGWKAFGGNCYLFSSTSTTFYGAQDQCRTINANLLDIRTQEENQFIASQTQGSGHWIGLRGIRLPGWTWDASSRPLTSDSYNNWALGSSSSNENCTALYRNDGQWSPIPCYGRLSFVCKAMKEAGSCGQDWAERGQHCYLLVFARPELKNWDAARQHCASLSADLTDIGNREENEFIHGLVRGNLYGVNWWIGLGRHLARWTWNNDNAGIDYSNWGSDENPGVIEGDNSCAQVWTGGKWKVSRCSDSHPYICKTAADTCQRLPFGPCSQTCGAATKSRTIICIRGGITQIIHETVPCNNLPPCSP